MSAYCYKSLGDFTLIRLTCHLLCSPDWFKTHSDPSEYLDSRAQIPVLTSPTSSKVMVEVVHLSPRKQHGTLKWTLKVG